MAITPRQLDAFTADPGPLLEILGETAVSYFQDAFSLQRLGGQKWAARYPGQPAPKLNIAGAISDFSAGRTAPKSRRFSDRKAGIDTGFLRDSISARTITVGGQPAVEVGSTVHYAERFQRGGVSSIDITETTKRGIKAFLKTARGAAYRDKLGPFMGKVKVLRTQLIPRPFIASTPELVALLVKTTLSEVGRLY